MAALALAVSSLIGRTAGAEVVYEGASAYHHIRVVDERGTRMLSFDGSRESLMSLQNPLTGHFEYINYFHLPWLWSTNLERVAMLGLGGGSCQRLFQHYYPDVQIDTVELDPLVVRVAQDYFGVRPTPKHTVHQMDGRVYLRRVTQDYDLIILDAYTSNPYGSHIPFHLATREFFTIAAARLRTNGVLAYNVIGQVDYQGRSALGSVYRTLKTVFPQVYLFPAKSSQNVVMLATRESKSASLVVLQQRFRDVLGQRATWPPSFSNDWRALRLTPPASLAYAPVLTDDFAPANGLLSVGR